MFWFSHYRKFLVVIWEGASQIEISQNVSTVSIAKFLSTQETALTVKIVSFINPGRKASKCLRQKMKLTVFYYLYNFIYPFRMLIYELLNIDN